MASRAERAPEQAVGTGRLTRRELEARRERAQEGWARFAAAKQQHEEEDARWEARGNAFLDLRHLDAEWNRQVLAWEQEMRVAIALIREGLPGTTLQLVEALVELGAMIDTRQRMRDALPLFTEGITLLLSQPQRDDKKWAYTLNVAAIRQALLLQVCGRQAEAIPSLQAAIQSQYTSGWDPPDANTAITLVTVYNDLGRYRLAVEVECTAERMLEVETAYHARRQGPGEFETSIGSKRPLMLRMMLSAALATAYEGLDRPEECMRYTNDAVQVGHEAGVNTGEVLTCFERMARLGVRLHKDYKTAETMLQLVLQFSRGQLECGLGVVCHNFEAGVMTPMRLLVRVWRKLGKEAEARTLELDLDETKSIMESWTAAALQELQRELRSEAQGAAAAACGNGAAAVGAGGSGLKRPTRKQQKCKAAQRRKAAERAAAEAAAAGAGADEAKGGDGVEEVTAAVARLQVHKTEELEPEPEPEPEECAICLNDLPPAGAGPEGGAVLLTCSHTFHSSCLDRWKDKCLEKAVPYTCALCRRPVVAAANV